MATIVCTFFGERLLLTDLWPPRSPDLTPPDFFLWGTPRRGLLSQSRKITDLKAVTAKEINLSKHTILKKVFTNMMRRAGLSISTGGGGHFQHLL